MCGKHHGADHDGLEQDCEMDEWRMRVDLVGTCSSCKQYHDRVSYLKDELAIRNRIARWSRRISTVLDGYFMSTD